MKDKYEAEKVSKGKLKEDMEKLREFYDNRIRSVEGGADLPLTVEGKNTVSSVLLHPLVTSCPRLQGFFCKHTTDNKPFCQCVIHVVPVLFGF